MCSSFVYTGKKNRSVCKNCTEISLTRYRVKCIEVIIERIKGKTKRMITEEQGDFMKGYQKYYSDG